MSSSPESARVLRDVPTTNISAPELRTGTWTRFGGSSVLGDTVTEDVLSSLADTTRAVAQAQGYATGWAEGRRAAAEEAAATAREQAEMLARAEARRDDEHRAALARLDRVLTSLDAAVTTATAAVEERALTLACELTTLLVGHELRTTPDSAADAVRRAAELSAGEPAVLVRMSPDDAWSGAVEELTGRGLRVVPDAALANGDVIVETDGGVIDGRIGAALDRVRAALS